MSGKFLVAARDRGTAQALENALKEEQHRVQVVLSGLDVVDSALDQKPDAIFLNVTLEEMSGLEAARALRALAPTAAVPIIFLAENAAEAQQVAEIRLPLTECLTAPYDLVEVKTHAAAGWHIGEYVIAVRPMKAENAWMLAILDPLTRLYHRRYLMHILAYEAKRSARYKIPLSVLLVDVDNLNEINRTHGILIGDSVLIETGQWLLKMMRYSEIVGRNERQDFLIIAPHTDETSVRARAEQIRRGMAEHHFVLDKFDLHVTVSLGVASAQGGDLAENLALLGRAETALDRAKRTGKNRVEVG